MLTVLYLFALLTKPHDKYICDLWTRAITQEGMIAACGFKPMEVHKV